MLRVGRNDPVEFARRVRKNFEFIERASHGTTNSEVHVVTQLAVSLLGLVVIPVEKKLVQEDASDSLALLETEGWPHWRITLDCPPAGKPSTTTLHRLLWHLRNAVAHGHLIFSSDSRSMEDVSLVVEDGPGNGADINFRAEIQARELREFCLRVLRRLEDSASETR